MRTPDLQQQGLRLLHRQQKHQQRPQGQQRQGTAAMGVTVTTAGAAPAATGGRPPSRPVHVSGHEAGRDHLAPAAAVSSASDAAAAAAPGAFTDSVHCAVHVLLWHLSARHAHPAAPLSGLPKAVQESSKGPASCQPGGCAPPVHTTTPVVPQQQPPQHSLLRQVVEVAGLGGVTLCQEMTYYQPLTHAPARVDTRTMMEGLWDSWSSRQCRQNIQEGVHHNLFEASKRV